MFDGRCGGIVLLPGIAVFPPKTAEVSFPGGGQQHETRGEGAIPSGYEREMVNGAAMVGNFQERPVCPGSTEKAAAGNDMPVDESHMEVGRCCGPV